MTLSFAWEVKVWNIDMQALIDFSTPTSKLYSIDVHGNFKLKFQTPWTYKISPD